MKDSFFKLAIKMQILLDKEGQDLVEYALVVAMIAFAATASMAALAHGINNAFAGIGNTLSRSIT